MHQRLTIRLLGELEVDPVSTLPPRFGRKAQALFVFLVMERRKVSVDRLLTLFWQGQRNKRNRLDNELTYLRKLFPPGFLPIRYGFLHWLVPDDFLQVDAFEFLRLIAENRQNRWQTAVSLYRDTFWLDATVEDCGPELEHWLASQRQRFEQAMIHLLEQMLASQSEVAIDAKIVDRLLQIDPLHEVAHQHKMRGLLQNGRLNAAVSHYQAYTKLLEIELGVQPTVHMQRLYDKALRTRSMPSNSVLLAPKLPIVGRHVEQAQIIDRIRQPGCRLLTILGPGGIGKTRLAQQVAHEVQPLFVDGVIFLDVTAVDTHQLPYQLANALNISLFGQPEPQAHLFNLLRWEKILIVFDNFEPHLPDGAQFLSALLAAAPDIKCLTTSRERLGLRMEWLFSLNGLGVPPKQASTQQLSQYASAQLFGERAQQIYPAFQLANGNAEAISAICRLVFGMPLAIELAAYWSHAYSCREIQQMIEHNLDQLLQTGVDVPKRHWSIQATFDTSWQRLTDAERTHFAALTVFPGHFSAKAAARITGASKQMLTKLVNRSLLEKLENGRYKMHPLLRQYGISKLEENQKMLLSYQAEFENYFITFVQERNLTRPGGDQKIQFQEIVSEIDNILHVWNTAVRNQNARVINDTLDGIWAFYELTGGYTSGVFRINEAIDALQNVSPSSDDLNLVISLLLSRKAWFDMRPGRFYEGKYVCKESFSIVPNKPDAKYQIARGRALVTAALLDWYLGDYDQAALLAEKGMAICSQHDDTFWLMQSVLYSGMINEAQGNYAEAVDLYQKGLQLSLSTKEFVGVSTLYMLLASINLTMGDATQAEHYINQAEKYADLTHNNFMIAFKYLVESAIHLTRFDFNEAVQLVNKSLSISMEISDHWLEFKCYIQLGGIATASGKFELAEKNFLKVLEKARNIHAAREMLQASIGLLNIFVLQSKVFPEYTQILESILTHPALDYAARKKAQALRKHSAFANGEATSNLKQIQILQMIENILAESLKFFQGLDEIAIKSVH